MPTLGRARADELTVHIESRLRTDGFTSGGPSPMRRPHGDFQDVVGQNHTGAGRRTSLLFLIGVGYKPLEAAVESVVRMNRPALLVPIQSLPNGGDYNSWELGEKSVVDDCIVAEIYDRVIALATPWWSDVSSSPERLLEVLRALGTRQAKQHTIPQLVTLASMLHGCDFAERLIEERRCEETVARLRWSDRDLQRFDLEGLLRAGSKMHE